MGKNNFLKIEELYLLDNNPFKKEEFNFIGKIGKNPLFCQISNDLIMINLKVAIYSLWNNNKTYQFKSRLGEYCCVLFFVEKEEDLKFFKTLKKGDSVYIKGKERHNTIIGSKLMVIL